MPHKQRTELLALLRFPRVMPQGAIYVLAVAVLCVHGASAQSFSIPGPGDDIPPSPASQGDTLSPVNVTSDVTSVCSIVIHGLRHTWTGDLSFTLLDPDGEEYNLLGQVCFNEELTGSTLTVLETAASVYGETCPPPTGTYGQLFGHSSGQDVGLSSISGPAGEWNLRIMDSAFGDSGSFDGWTFNFDSGEPTCTCTPAERAACSQYAVCTKESGGAVCSCLSGFTDDNGDGSVCTDIDECKIEELTLQCDRLAYCVNSLGSWDCQCPDGFLGGGRTCSNDAWGVRVVATVPGVDSFTAEQIEVLKRQYATIVTGKATLAANDTMVGTMPVFGGAWAYGSRLLGVTEGPNDGDQVTLIALFHTFEAANISLSSLSQAPSAWSAMGASSIDDGPAVYRWSGGSTSDPLEIPPSGMTVDSVFFDINCLDSGCWKVDVTYTKGSDDFNVFFLPSASASDALSYDPDYAAIDPTWGISEADTFFPVNHPCTTLDYDPSSGALPATITACCIPEFLAMYRPVAAFGAAMASIGIDLGAGVCGTGDRERAIDRSTVPWFTQRGQTTSDPLAYAPPSTASVVHNVFVDGSFSGLASHIYHTEVADAYIGIYRARLELDEVELRSLAGIRRGTVGVEHTVDTFVGLINFSPTGTRVLDSAAMQVNIHLEKTSFFSVSTHGTNDYTFLEYVNLRLVAIYNQDDDFSGTDESSARTVRTSSAKQANYVQVTFTLGSQYAVDAAGSPLIPLDSVRAGHGTFFDSADLEHMCSDWTRADGSFDDQTMFNTTLTTQDCAPSADMCVSPSSIPDSFVSFNIPLGVDYLVDDASGASATLSNNVFVDMVISATEPGSTRENPSAPNDGGDPTQLKTTLSASIPIVEGGVNIFCDGFTAKTDLKDVANADIIVGSASTAEELTRLRIKQDIASTQLTPESITEINSDSIEAGLMTLVLKGNASYFLRNAGRSSVTLELEDVITLHIMEDDGSGADTAVSASVQQLLSAPPQDNTLPGGLDTDGYALNGAFYFTIDRSAQRAHLEPLDDLLTLCPFSPSRPAGSMPLETCVMRRDVRYRDFPSRDGAKSTAVEICTAAPSAPGTGVTPGTCPSASGPSSDEAKFFVTIFGDNAFARSLATSYAAVIAAEYDLNGRYRRAFWINPGYEWTPTQTGGTAIFSVSQKLYLFALITLDEGVSDDAGLGVPAVGPTLRRRMLLQSSSEEQLQDGQAAVSAQGFQFETTPMSVMAKAFNVPEERVATFSVRLRLSQAEACMSTTDLQTSIRATLEEYLATAASALHTVLVTTLKVDRADVECAQPAQRSLDTGSTEAAAELTMMLVFVEGAASTISLDKFATMDGVESIEPLVVAPSVNIKAPTNWVRPSSDVDGSPDDFFSSNTVIIASAGGALVFVALALALLILRRRGRHHPSSMAEVHTVDIDDLKQQLQAQV